MKQQERLEEVVESIVRLEEQRARIYAGTSVSPQEAPELAKIEHELQHLWDLRRRMEAAQQAGLGSVPVAPPAHPEVPPGYPASRERGSVRDYRDTGEPTE